MDAGWKQRCRGDAGCLTKNTQPGVHINTRWRGRRPSAEHTPGEDSGRELSHVGFASTMPGSVTSRKSGGAYRTVAKTSQVDETLFCGKSKSGKKSDGRASAAAPSAIKSRASDVVSVKRSDVERMLRPSPIMTAEQVAALQREAQEKRDRERAHSNARKARMMKLEEEAKKKAPPTESERLKQETDRGILAHAKHLLEEQLDDVKQMNQMMLYSKCVTIRDSQLEEKKHLMLEDEKEQRQLDLAMEVERVKALENYEARERQRVEERKKGAAVLMEQVEERKQERIRQEELRDLERVQMLKEIERLKEEDLRQQVERKQQAKELLDEVAAANQEQIERKKEMKVRELEEDARIQEYVLQKQLREQAIEDEKARIAAEKELETARLRALQEKAADVQAELDELRARRHQETVEREWRQKERAAKEREIAMYKDLAVAREAQKASRIKQLAEMAELERQEFERMLIVHKQKQEEEHRMEELKTTLRKKHNQDLLAQIAANEEKTKLEKQRLLEEGNRDREKTKLEKQRLERIKSKKLEDLGKQGVPSKYQSELSRYKVAQW